MSGIACSAVPRAKNKKGTDVVLDTVCVAEHTLSPRTTSGRACGPVEKDMVVVLEKATVDGGIHEDES